MAQERIEYTGGAVEALPLREFARKAYLDYSMYVILDRALPHVGDGLKPVQRRIVYAMAELGLRTSTAPGAGSGDSGERADGRDTNRTRFKKSARTVGDVLGKYHPHGDTACYEAMVLMAQPFSIRYPIVDGQGNWGSPDDPRSFAAMRYTEARLTAFAEILLGELGQGTTRAKPNFDGSLEEPELLPARLPTVLLNGTSGIAVGMATDVPPHNLGEVAAACVRLLEDPAATVADLCEHVRGPDFPTGAEIITPAAEIAEIYRTGVGTVRVRATYERDGGSGGAPPSLVITQLPYQVSGSKVLEQIGAQMAERRLPMVEELRDESDEDSPVRLVLGLRSSRVDTAKLMSHLFASTELERTVRVNLNVIGLDGRPRVKDLRELLGEWIEFRRSTVRHRLEFRLDRVETRMHRLAGLLVAYLNIDEVIAIVREEERPKPVLMQRFDLTDAQAEAILELRLRHLARLEEVRIRAERDELEAERRAIEEILASDASLNELIRDEILADAERHGDARRSLLVERAPSRTFARTDLASAEPVTVILSRRGWVRAAKGHQIDPTSLSYRAGDEFLMSAAGRSNQTAAFLDSTGRSYALPAHSLPSARGQGEPLAGRLDAPDGAEWCGVLLGEEGERIVLAAGAGYGFVTEIGNLWSKSRSGRIVIPMAHDDRLLPPVRVSDPHSDEIAIASTSGYLLVYPIDELPTLSRGKGAKLMGIPLRRLRDRLESVSVLASVPAGQSLTVVAGRRHLTLRARDLEGYRGVRSNRGRLLPRGFRKVEALVAGSRDRPSETAPNARNGCPEGGQ